LFNCSSSVLYCVLYYVASTALVLRSGENGGERAGGPEGQGGGQR
jgi:hypothetical protein